MDTAVKFISDTGGPVLGMRADHDFEIIQVDGKKFKNLSRSGKLEKYEDWRLSPQERAADLASRLTDEQIAGLMLFGNFNAVPEDISSGPPVPGGLPEFLRAKYNGLVYEKSGAEPWDLADGQIENIREKFIRSMTLGSVQSVEAAVRWVNNMQGEAENQPFGVPINFGSDPRHARDENAVFNLGSGKHVSQWPENIGLAATFDPETVKKFAQVASGEYRAIGVCTGLSPQVDLGTEPRWERFNGTFGESPELVTDLARAYCDGFQTTGDGGWGSDSVVAMAKHWPGGGTGEGGRDAHFYIGKYAVYPGDNFEEHLRPFVDGAFKLDGGTEKAAAVMPYYTISFDRDKAYGENVANAYSKYILTDLLRNKYGYDGLICTDWGVTGADGFGPDPKASGTCWGVENLSYAQRHKKAIEAGVDQFGGLDNAAVNLEAFRLIEGEIGHDAMRQRIEASARRILTNFFRVGLFENPYLDEKRSKAIVGCPENMAAGYEAQLKSIVMLKNKSALPIKKGAAVYIPKYEKPVGGGWFSPVERLEEGCSVDPAEVAKFYTVTDDPQKADFALLYISSPQAMLKYKVDRREPGGSEYYPFSLQYAPYTAEYAREVSIAGGDPFETGKNRSYKGKTVHVLNEGEEKLVQDTKRLMGDKPVVVVLKMDKPTILSGIEPWADAILVQFKVKTQAVMDVISGAYEPSGLLPAQMPANMKTVEEHCEDVPFDKQCLTDSEGNTYDFGFGLNWSGVIRDKRTEKYIREK